MEVVADRIVMPNMATVRVILVYASVITTVFMLVWMISEQEKVRFKNVKTWQMNFRTALFPHCVGICVTYICYIFRSKVAQKN